ncbi:hypothetical protein Bca52824_064831 [Brassica carinata]|uniref:Uncharacterized protein n=1 Tax=Brassica carinata TaxID=52824 RepID=A0A8X7UBR8_BRACI|nr:hypothetical protein Bca52824_064831 [Brassica carinata]
MLRAASESSRSSYYSLHMEGSGKLELRWEMRYSNQEAAATIMSSCLKDSPQLRACGTGTRGASQSVSQRHHSLANIQAIGTRSQHETLGRQ